MRVIKNIPKLLWHARLLLFLIIVIMVIVIAIYKKENHYSSSKDNFSFKKLEIDNKGPTSTPAPVKIVKRSELYASVNFTGTQFIIRNLDQYSCENARMELNDKYRLEGDTLHAGMVYKVGAGQFTKSDGTRFNSFATKPMNFFISCRGDNELSSAGWYGTFK